jgi:hypothetical protein
MAIRLRYKVSVAVSSSSAEENDLGNAKIEVVSDAPNEGGVWKTTLAAATTMVLSLDGITNASFLMLRFTPKDPTQVMTPVALTLNGATPALTIEPCGDMDEAIFAISAAITSVSIANLQAGAIALDVTVGVTGD